MIKDAEAVRLGAPHQTLGHQLEDASWSAAPASHK